MRVVVHDALEERRVARESGSQVVESVDRVLAEAGEARAEVRERSARAVRAECIREGGNAGAGGLLSKKSTSDYTEVRTSGSPSPCRH